MSSIRPPPHLPRVVIERITPELDGGRHPVKCVVGDTVRVSVDIFKDGHDLIGAQLLYRGPGEQLWREAPLEHDYDLDRWSGRFVPDRIGAWEYSVEAWPDPFRTWREDLKKRLDAGQDVTSELLEGAQLVARKLAWIGAEASLELSSSAKALANVDATNDARLAVAFSKKLQEGMLGPLDPEHSTRYESRSLTVDRPLARFGAWYELFPRSQGTVPGKHGTFADVERRLPDLEALGFDVLYLPPVHPIGPTHRKGRNNATSAEPGDVGSPWAIGDRSGGHTALHAELGSFEDFRSLVNKARAHGMELALDFALQCSPDHPWIHDHPEWFFVRPDGTLRHAENPPKKYEDIYPLNFWCSDRHALWTACRDAMLFWVDHGVKIFRVDNPHTKPLAFWEWAIAEIQRRHPDVIFLAEAFTRPKRMRGLAKLGFTQSYTYFTWKNTSWELREYLDELASSEMAEYYRPNFFANTPDILHEYLQDGGRPAFRIRLLLAATLSPTYGIYSGYELCENTPVRRGSEEYLDSEKYEIRQRDWQAPGNIRADITRINRIRREHPALQRLANLSFLPSENEAVLAYLKRDPTEDLIIVVTTDPHKVHESFVEVPVDELGLGEHLPYTVVDLLTDERYEWHGSRNYVKLDPAEKVGHVLRIVRSDAEA
ncbi:MAG: alpha-1,4-glucan--maltose-1-phosphate maltosyltransferase [Myxococcales bacterium]|nr:alpha-1,4-glucan--maltose-1-phosphate maltosyltransferase [Myxococcales bacterium]